MVRAIVEETAALTSLVLFLSMIAIWALAIAAPAISNEGVLAPRHGPGIHLLAACLNWTGAPNLRV